MMVVSSKEFATHQKKYYSMAMNSEVCIKRGRTMFHLMYKPMAEEQSMLQPDEDLCRAITFDELLESTYKHIDKLFAGK